MAEFDLDPTLLADFIVESKELLDEYANRIIALETEPEDMALIGAIFRAAHTLKGSSAFFNLTHIKNFAHKLENLLDEVRNRTRRVTSEAIDFMLSGGRHLSQMFDRLQAGDYSTTATGEETDFLKRLLAFMEAKPAPALSPEEALAELRRMARDFRRLGTSAAEILNRIEAVLDGLGIAAAASEENAAPASQTKTYGFQGVDLTSAAARAEALMATAVAAGKIAEEEYEKALTNLFDQVEEHGLEALKTAAWSALEDFQAVRQSPIEFDELILGMMKSKLDEVLGLMDVRTLSQPFPAAPTNSTPATAAPQKTGEPADPQAESSRRREEKTERKTMRIDEDKVDGFMNYVGELIVTSETFTYLQKMIESQSVNPATIRAFKNANQAFRELSDELQESLMEIRRVPIKGLLQKVNMMARELSHQMNKKVRVVLDGQDVQLDKSIAESLEGPLVHVVRNSLDHGLEPPGERMAAGKAEEGFLRVIAEADKEHFYLEVRDDGRGIDPVRMRRSAVEKGLMNTAQAEALTDKEAVHLIFRAGFSTAKEVTDVSGRGVGMDVVRNNINQMNGSIQIDSQPGHGTAIKLKIPLSVTLQVVRALLVRVGRDNFIISLDDIVESLRPSPGDWTTIEGRNEVILRRGQIFPLIRLYDVFGLKTEITDPAQAILVVVDTSLGRYGLMVDEVLGQQQVVVKELDARFRRLTFLAGSATLGDGRLGLVLDAEGVVRLAQGKK
jgi:two-component system chemotaxis sensor kinase CheA